MTHFVFLCFGTYESAVVLKRTFYSSGPGGKDLLYVGAVSLAALAQRSGGGGGGGSIGLDAEETLAAGWLEERWHVDAGHSV